MIDYTQFQEEVREALYHLYDYERLQELSLCDLLQLEMELAGTHPLNRFLTRAIEALKPAPSVPPDTPDWRAYSILFYRFIQCMTVKEVAAQLGIGERHFRRHQTQAIHLLANRLWESQVDATVKPHQKPQEEVVRNIDDQASIEANLAWLQNEQTLQQANVGVVMAGVEKLLAHLVQTKGASMEVTLSPLLPRMRIHPLALRQILVNMLSYLLEIAPDGRILVTGREENKEIFLLIHCEVSSDVERITTPPEDPLAITHQLLEMYQGRLELTTPLPGIVVYTIQVPAAQRTPVMIVEDNADAAALFTRYLADSAYRPVLISNGVDALALLPDVRPGAIVLDVMMPGQDGWETLILLKAHPLAENVPIIVATILTDRELAISLGAANFLHKPVSQAQLLAALDQAVANHSPTTD